jgi:hypothetical protein
MAFKNIFKKEEPKVEKKPVSLYEMKIKYGVFSKKTDEFIKKYEALIEKKVKKATELKMKGLDASLDIKDITRYKSKIVGLERRRSLFERQIDNMEELEMQQGFLTLIGDMANMMGDSAFDLDQFSKVNDDIINKTLKLGEQQRKMESKMEELDAALDSYDALTASDFSKEEASINATIDRFIADARYDENVTADAIASRVSSSILVDN